MTIIENLSHPLIHSIGWTVLHSLWQWLLIALLWRLALITARRASSNTRYTISLIALLAVPLSFAVTIFRQWHIYQDARRISTIFMEGVSLASTADSPGLYIVEKSSWLQWAPLETITPYVFYSYLAGMVLFAIAGLVQYSRVYTMRKRFTRPLPQSIRPIVDKMRKLTRVSAKIPVFISEKALVPVVAGFLKPVVLLPISVLSSLTPEQIEIILMHEFYHLRRRDHYINLFQNITEIVFFYHPVVWWISRNIRMEREHRVDEWIVLQTGKPMEYARALVTLETDRSGLLQPALAAVQSENQLLKRIKKILTMKTSEFNPQQKLAALLVLSSAILSLAWLSPASGVNHFASPETSYASQYTLAVNHGEMIRTGSLLTDTLPVSGEQPAKEQNKKATFVTTDGTSYQWEELSPKQQEQIQRAIQQARLSVVEANREIMEQLNSEEFRKQMEETRRQINRSIMEANEFFNSGEFQKQMEETRSEIEKSLQEAQKHLKSEEFQQQMEKARKETEKAMQEINEHLRSEEFRNQIDRSIKEAERAMRQVNDQLGSEEFRQQIEQSIREAEKAVRAASEQFNSEEFRNEMRQLQQELQKMMQEIGRAIQQESGQPPK